MIVVNALRSKEAGMVWSHVDEAEPPMMHRAASTNKDLSLN